MKNKWKKIVAFIMVFVIVLSNTSISSNRYVKAEEKSITTDINQDISTEEEETTTEQQETTTLENSTTQSDNTEKRTSEEVLTETPFIEINTNQLEVQSNTTQQATTQSESEATTTSESDTTQSDSEATTTSESDTTQSDSEATTTSESDTTQGTPTETPTVSPVVPDKTTILINNSAISNYKELKVGTKITIQSDNCDETWTVKIYNNGIEQKIIEKVNNSEVEKTRYLKEGTSYEIKDGPTKIEFYNNGVINDSLTTTIASFSNYTYKAKLGDKLYDITKQDITFEQNNSNTVASIKGFTMLDTLPVIVETSTQSVIEIPVADIVKPTITKDKDNYNIGDTITISISNKDSVNMALWECKYSLNKGTAQTINETNNAYTWTLSPSGKYDFYFATGNSDKSNTISTTVYNIVEFNDNNTDKWNLTVDNKIYYTNQKKIELQCPLKSSDLKVNGSNDNANFTDYRLVLGAEIVFEEDYNVGYSRRTIKITSAKVTKEGIEQSYYQMKDINGQTIKLGFTITKTDLLVEPRNDAVTLSYRTNVVRMDRSDYSLSQVIDTEVNELDSEILKSLKISVDNAMDMPTTENVKTVDEKKIVTYSIDDVTQDENGYYCFTKNKNYNLLFDKNEFSKGQTIPEIINSYEIKDAITLAQFGKNLYLDGATPIEEAENQDGNMVGGSVIETTLSNAFSGHYKSIYYRKHNGQVADITSITDKSIIKDLKPSFGNGEDIAYYDIILSDEAGLYPTVAAVVRIVKVTEAEKYTDILQKNIVSNGTEYHTINLFYNNEPTELDFEKDGLDINNSTDINNKAVACNPSEKIVFTLKGTKETRTVQCGFLDLSKLNNNNVYSIKSMSVGTLKESYGLTLSSGLTSTKTESLNENEVLTTYEYTVPNIEGNYIVYVLVTNGQQVSEAHISNGFVIDVTDPTITAVFRDGSGDKFDAATKKDEKDYFQNGPITVDVVISDEYSPLKDTKEIRLTATDKDGNEIIVPQDAYSVEAYVEDADESEKDASEDAEEEKKPAYQDKFRLKLDKSANYSLQVYYKDFSGNEGMTSTYYFTIDMDNPTGEISVDGFKESTLWSSFIQTIMYKLFNKKTATFKIKGEDQLSQTTDYYYIADKEMTEDDLDKLEDQQWTEYKGTAIEIPSDKRKVVYGKVEDKSGRATYISTDGLLTDTVRPDIIIKPINDSNKNGFYNADITYSVNVEDVTDAVEDDYSGLQKISYKIITDGKETESKEVYKNTEKTAGLNKKEFEIKVDSSENNSNDVEILVTAIDMAGNEREGKASLQIDKVKPEISITYDNNYAVNGNYYNSGRTATIEIKERNLNTNDIKIDIVSEHGSKASIGKWTHSDNVGKSDEAVYTCKVTFSADDDYDFKVSCVDKAGNEDTGDYSTKFTVDSTRPVINVNYSGGDTSEYRNHEVTATITITEHNFDASSVSVDVSGENTDSVPSVSEFRSDGDTHTATVHFGTNGTYQLSASLEDKAGNTAQAYEGNSFTVDLDAPKIEIKNISNQSAYKGDVKPVVTFTDENYDASKVTLSVVGANNGNVKLEKLSSVKTVIQNGEEYALEFPKDSSVDDLYTLTATIEDKAGNQKEEKVEFSINRYGSIYTLGSTTDKWLDSGVCSYLMEEKSIVIVETNVNDIESRSISYSVGGVNGTTVNVPELSECTQEEKNNNLYYKMTKDKKANGWVQYRYEIQADNFEDEGIYNITIHSKDTVGNETSNISNLHTDNKLSIQFAVDKTVPNVVFSGVEENALYKETEHTVLLDAQDNIALDQVTVYLNGKEYGKYSAEDIAKIDSGLISIKVPQSNSRQTVQVAARDMAGNMIGDVSSGEVTNGCEEISLLVTTNKFVQYMYTKWMWLATAIGFVLVSSGIVFLVFRKRRKK